MFEGERGAELNLRLDLLGPVGLRENFHKLEEGIPLPLDRVRLLGGGGCD